MTIPLRMRGIEAAPSSAHGPIPFTRLVRVEWAKATDTRAARWLLALVALSTAGMMLAPILAPTRFDQTSSSYLEVAAVTLVILLPVVAILMLTGEWSQRSVFTTFTQEPRRIRVVNAKLAVSMVLVSCAAVFGGVVTVAGPDGLLVVDASGGRVTTEVVAGVARDHQVLLTELRRSETNGLEQLFFSLTAAKAAPPEEAAA